MVGQEGEYRPLVLDSAGRLYLYRYWWYECTIADDLRARADGRATGVDSTSLRAGLRRLFPTAAAGETNWQKVAAAVAVLRRLCVLSGGPGTGKTTTVTRILSLLIEQTPAKPPRIALAAPTGKAAARLQESVAAAKQRLAIEPAVRAAIPGTASTLHRLLGVRGDSVRFRHHRENPLALDVLVVDEASMVDVALMAKLLAALPPAARLILLGDKDQLASVEAGAVLGDVCGEATGFSSSFRERLRAVLEEPLPSGSGRCPPIGNAIVLLRKSFRFGADSGIGALAEAVKAGEAEHARSLLQGGRFRDIAWRPLGEGARLDIGIEERIRAGFATYLEQLLGSAEPQAILAAFNHFRVLCAHRRGPLGVNNLNVLIEERLRRWVPIDTRQTWYPGRPVMVNSNDYQLGLFNGDVGIALRDPRANGAVRVFFETPEGGLRRFPPVRLPPHQTVFAMTVHKAQGSEFDEVLVVLPEALSPVLTRELVYTAITRARSRIELWADDAVFVGAVTQSVQRSSGLRERLWGDPAR